jgi:methylglutaconyl-CoA hydratase
MMTDAESGSASDVLTVEWGERIVKIQMSRPDRRNALNAELVGALIDAIKRVGQSANARVIVLSGSGKVFSAGADLDALRTLQSATDVENLADSRRLAELFEAIRMCPVPIVAQVHGAAIAGGCGLAAACDITVADEQATFGFSEVRIGFVPAIILTYLRTRVSEAVLRKYLLTGLTFDGREAARIGLIAEAVPAKDLKRRVNEIADHVAFETSRSAVAMTKDLFLRMGEQHFAAALEQAIQANVKARSTDDCNAGVSAFLDKTDPPWKRR